MNHRIVEWRGGPEHRIGERLPLPEAEAAAAIAAGLATGVTPVRFKVGAAPYNVGEVCGLPDHVAAKLVQLDWCEILPVRPPDGDMGTETAALQHPPTDRTIHTPPVTKEIKS